MTGQKQEPGSGRSTSGRAFEELIKEVAVRNEQAHKEARKLRTEREREGVLRRRRLDRA